MESGFNYRVFVFILVLVFVFLMLGNFKFFTFCPKLGLICIRVGTGSGKSHITDLNISHIYVSGKLRGEFKGISLESIKSNREMLIILGLFNLEKKQD